MSCVVWNLLVGAEEKLTSCHDCGEVASLVLQLVAARNDLTEPRPRPVTRGPAPIVARPSAPLFLFLFLFLFLSPVAGHNARTR